MKRNKYPIPNTVVKDINTFHPIYFRFPEDFEEDCKQDMRNYRISMEKRKTARVAHALHSVKIHPYGFREKSKKFWGYDYVRDMCPEMRRYIKKAARAKAKRELFSAIEDHISESMYDPEDLFEEYISDAEFAYYLFSIGL